VEAPAIKRKLATILAADAVGYSRLMSEDEEATVRTLSEYRAAMAERVGAHDGRIFHAAGDSMLAEFSSPVEALRSALAIQHDLAERNQSLPPARVMRYRIGLHLGDVVVDGDNLLGDGINVAARLEGLAEPGGILLSAAVHEQVEGKLALTFEDQGEKTVKNIARPVQVYRVAVGPARAATASATTDLPAPGLPDRPSIAVLPFDNLGGDPEQGYFADGITEDLITELSRFQELHVIARNSVFIYKGKPTKVQDVGHELKVRYVLEGSVRKAGNRVRVTAQLVEAASGHHLWAERFDRELADLFDVQDEVTQRIVATLVGKLEATERRRVRQSERTDNLQAYDLVLRGREHWLRFTREDNLEARRLYEKAIALDPEYARAYASLAWTYYMEHDEKWGEAPEATLRCAFEAATKGVAVNPASHTNHLVLGWVYLAKGQPDQAVEAMKRALELNPNDADSYIFLANATAFAGGGDQAVALIEEGFRLNPNPNNWYLSSLGFAYFTAHRYEDAAATLGKIEKAPMMAKRWLAAALSYLGREAEAKAAAAAYLERYPDFSLSEHLKTTYFKHARDREHYAEGLRKAGMPE
jgi:adenylate cyclase